MTATPRKVMVDGAARPACNDGALPANGLLYVGPWQCDCNLSLIGRIAKCSAGDFQFDFVAKDEERLESAADAHVTAELRCVRGRLAHLSWQQRSQQQFTREHRRQRSRKNGNIGQTLATTPTPAISAGGLVFVSGFDGKTRAIDARTGQLALAIQNAGGDPHAADGCRRPDSMWARVTDMSIHSTPQRDDCSGDSARPRSSD